MIVGIIWDRIVIWLDGRLPVWCTRCERWVFKVNTKSARHRLAGLTRVCLECYEVLYGGRR